MARKRNRKKTSKDTLAGIAVLVIVTTVVMALAFVSVSHSRPDVATAGQTPGFTKAEVQSGSQSDADSSPDDSSSEPSDRDFEVAPTRMVLGALDATTAYRSKTGQCPDTSAKVSLTTDGGASWKGVGKTELSQASAVQRIVVGVGGYAAVIALDANNCGQPVAVTTFDDGAAWQDSPEATSQSWFIDPEDPTVIHTPFATTLDLPCEGARMASAGVERVSVACSDGSVFVSPDSGETWDGGTAVEGLDALAATDSRVFVGSLTSSCSGVEVNEMDWSLNDVTTHCVEDAEADAGSTAISVASDGTLWLWAGDDVLRSTDDGFTWTR